MSKEPRSKFSTYDVYLTNGKGFKVSADDILVREGTPPVILFRAKVGTTYIFPAAIPVNVIEAIGLAGYISRWTPPQ